jgi:N-acetylglucosamine kinase-like BadF-type ATPase
MDDLSAPDRKDAAAQLVVGIDGGGTRTRVRLANTRGEVLGVGEAGPSNPHANGMDAAQQEILAAIGRAFDDAGIVRQIVAAACLGIGGVDRADERTQFEGWAKQHIAPRVAAMNDGEIVMAAASAASWGIALIAGTGSICWGKTRAGKIARAGGWGYLLGDEGSGYDLGREALRAATQAADGRGAGRALLDAILGYWKLNDPKELIGKVYQAGSKPADIAQLAPLVIHLAEEGDALAQALVDNAVKALATAVAAVTHALAFQEPAIPLALTGGLLLESEFFRARLLALLPPGRYSPVLLVDQPLLGAVRVAITLAQGG